MRACYSDLEAAQSRKLPGRLCEIRNCRSPEPSTRRQAVWRWEARRRNTPCEVEGGGTRIVTKVAVPCCPSLRRWLCTFTRRPGGRKTQQRSKVPKPCYPSLRRCPSLLPVGVEVEIEWTRASNNQLRVRPLRARKCSSLNPTRTMITPTNRPRDRQTGTMHLKQINKTLIRYVSCSCRRKKRPVIKLGRD